MPLYGVPAEVVTAIAAVGDEAELRRRFPEHEVHDCAGGVLTPGFVDSHTHAVFAGNRADLQTGGAKILDTIAPALAALPNSIEVDGHTNQLKATTSYYPSGWELSAARASTMDCTTTAMATSLSAIPR